MGAEIRVVVGQKWKRHKQSTVLAEVVELHGEHTAVLKWGPYGDGTYTSTGWGFAAMRIELELVQDVPWHDFSDRYCAMRMGLMCSACGAVQRLNEGPRCVPRSGWRQELERFMIDNMSLRLDGPPRSPPPVFTFRQSNPMLTGGVFSLRDEAQPRTRLFSSTSRWIRSQGV